MKNQKNLGQYFTPPYVADFMISLSKVSKNARVLEPACGNGVFLKILEDRGYKNVTGYEVDKTITPIIKANIFFKSFISEPITKNIDLVIGNPPYIRWKNLNEDLKEELLENKLWLNYFNGLSDYLYIFILKSVEHLREGGELIFITPEYWLNTKHAKSLRDYLVLSGYFTDIIHFNETPIFDGVASSIVIFKFVKSQSQDKKNKSIRVVKYKSTKRLNKESLELIAKNTQHEDIERFEREQFPLYKAWVLVPSKLENELIEFEDKCSIKAEKTLFNDERENCTLGDMADIANGMVSGLDRAFQIPPGTKLTKREQDSTLAVLKAKNIKPYIHGDITRYIFVSEQIENESDFKNRYPNFDKILMVHRDQLEQRYSYNKKINYWEWAFLRSYRLFSQNTERIFVPCKERISHKNYFRFSLAPKHVFPTQDVTAVFLRPETRESVHYILALLNNPRVFVWLKHKGVVKGSIVEFSEKPLASIPIRPIDWSNPSEVMLHEKITSLCKKYIERPEEETLSLLENKVSELF